jgi:aspartate/methionine/tyrosine aminotransferase
MDYLRWAKTHERVRFELTNSGVPTPPRELFDDGTTLPVDVRGTYGDPELIERIALRYRVDPDGVVPVPGASSAIFVALASAVEVGDAIAVERPVYPPISRVAEFLRLRVLTLPREPTRGFTVEPKAVEAALRVGARAVVVTNLHNPSGRWISRDAAFHLAELCATFHATLVIDEVYLDACSLTRHELPWTIANLAPGAIGINSLTKVYGLSGLRIGWLLTRPAMAERARTIMDLLSADNAAPSMALAIRAFQRMDRLEERYRTLYLRGQEIFREWLSSEPRVSGYPSHGAIFECLRLPAGVRSTALHERLVHDHQTRITPGAFFDLDDHIRLSIWLEPDDLREALSRLSAVLTSFPH